MNRKIILDFLENYKLVIINLSNNEEEYKYNLNILENYKLNLLLNNISINLLVLINELNSIFDFDRNEIIDILKYI